MRRVPHIKLSVEEQFGLVKTVRSKRSEVLGVFRAQIALLAFVGCDNRHIATEPRRGGDAV